MVCEYSNALERVISYEMHSPHDVSIYIKFLVLASYKNSKYHALGELKKAL